MNLHDDAAGPTFKIRCKKCKTVFTVFMRSFWGTGKKCPGCNFVHHGAGQNDVPSYHRLRD